MELTIPLTDLNGLVTPLPNVRKLDILKRRMIVSRKHTCNLFNLTTLGKKIVLLNMDQHVLQDNSDLASQHSSDMEIDTDDHDDSSSSDSNQDPFVQLLRNQGAVF